MTITVYMAYWEDRFSLSPVPGDEAFFRSLGNLALIVEGRTVLVAPDADGSPPVSIEPERSGGLTLKYNWVVDRQPWARFMRHEIEVVLEDDGSMTWEIPPDHELTWPKITTRGVIDDSAIAAREFALRARSAYEDAGDDGVRAMVRKVPETVRRLMDRQTWADIISETMQLERTL